jgi:hypothetical protein
VYFGTAALSSNCNCVLTYSVGNVQRISRPPAIPPEMLSIMSNLVEDFSQLYFDTNGGQMYGHNKGVTILNR